MTPACGAAVFQFWYRTSALRRRLLVLVAMLAGIAVLSRCGTGQSKPQEYQVKAAYLYNFGKFIEWPAPITEDESFAICVLGRDPFGPVLDATISSGVIDNQKLVARRIASLRDASVCRILFISSSEEAHLREILTSVERSGILTVSDLPDFTSNGGMIQFVLRENRVRFEVNLTATQKAGLILSSQLLKVATTVKTESRGKEVDQ